MRIIEVKIVNNNPKPHLGNEIKDLILSCYLEDAELDFDGFLEEIDKAERGDGVPTGYASNQTDVSFYKDKAVIEALWFDNEGQPSNGENFASIQIPLLEAKRLLLDWRKLLNSEAEYA